MSKNIREPILNVFSCTRHTTCSPWRKYVWVLDFLCTIFIFGIVWIFWLWCCEVNLGYGEKYFLRRSHNYFGFLISNLLSLTSDYITMDSSPPLSLPCFCIFPGLAKIYLTFSCKCKLVYSIELEKKYDICENWPLIPSLFLNRNHS